MTVQEYIDSELQHCTDYVLTNEDKASIDQQGMEAFIYAKLTSKKFRKWAVDQSSEQQAKQAIAINVKAGKPLQFRYPFGGYKLWRMPSSPRVDWAEFFAIAYYSRYIAPIAAAYEPGIEFKFASDDIIIERMDNVPAADTDAYFDSFKMLLDQFRPYSPSNFKMDIVRIGGLYEDKDQFERELAENIEHSTKEYANNVDKDKKQKMYTMSELNIQWQGAKDLTDLTDQEKRQIIEQGPIYHDAYCAVSKRREFNRGEDKIVIFTTIIPNAIAVGTTKSSVAKFWAGFGILETNGDSFTPRILSPTQLDQLEGSRFNLVLTRFTDMQNFKDIRVY